MRFELSTLFLAPLAAFALPLEASTDAIHADRIPTVKEAAVQARQLIKSEAIGTVSSVFPKDDPHGLGGQPIGLMEYYADCSTNGNPTFLAVGIATSFRNAEGGARISLAVREHKDSWSAASQHRLSLIGKLGPKVLRDSEEAERLKTCFTSRHRDARIWAPGNKIHESDWVTLEVETVFWFGGFGNVEYIGFIPVELYSNVTLEESGDDEGVSGGAKILFQSGLSSLRGLFRKG